MERVTLADLADGAGLLQLDPSGQPLAPLTVVDLDGADWSQLRGASERLAGRRTGVLVGVASEPLPPVAAALADLLTVALAPGGPGAVWAGGPDDLDAIAATIERAPLAATTMAGLLGLTSRLGVADGLVAESLAYSTLLAGPEYAAWRAATPRVDVPEATEPVRLDRAGDQLTITLNRPERHNAFGRAVRDGVLSGLELAELDASIHQVVLRGAGRSFCSGGDLDEFGTAPDLATAHLIRLSQSAGHAVHRLAERICVVVHGACIGAGVEVPSFAGRVEAHDDAWFRLPELGMGLVPGAGGTVSITHRIGRWRTAYLALTDHPVDVETALRWGLVDARA